jgi:5-methylcytosine-specific restriction endonuclease McrA
MTLQTCTIEHVIPSCKGGGNGTGNLMLSCHKCNQRRGSQDFYAFRARLTQGRKTPWREFPSDVEIILVTRKRNGAAA